MSRVAIGALLATVLAFSVQAMTALIDTDGDGKASFAELLAAYPGLSEAQLQDIDLDGDGFVSDEELMIAVGTDLFPDPETSL